MRGRVIGVRNLASAQPPTIGHVIRTMKDEFGSRLVGVLWTGSRAYGEARPNSDWDFFVLHQDLWRQRRLLKVGDSTIELFINPPDQIRREFAASESATIGMFARGRIVHDANGRMEQLQEEASQLWRGAPRPWTREEQDQWRYEILDLLQDIEDMLAEDPDAAAYLMGIAMQKVTEGYYRVNGFYEPKAKYVLADLAPRHPELTFQLRMIISGRQSLIARYQALRQLVEAVQKPIGGYLDTWQTNREPVEPFPGNP